MQQNDFRGEGFFLHSFEEERIFKSIRRADYQVLYAVQLLQEQSPGQKVYLAQLAEELHLSIPKMSRRTEKLQDKGLLKWKTDAEAERTYVDLTGKAVELMAEERAWMRSCYARIRAEIGEEELARTAGTMRRIAEILQDTRDEAAGE